MYKKRMSVLCIAVVAIAALCLGCAFAEPLRGHALAAEKQVTVAFDGKEVPVTDILTDIAKQAERRLLIESTVAPRPNTMCIQGIEFEMALEFVCMQRQDMKWRKIYLPPDSPLISRADELAKAARMAEVNGTPDVVVIKGSEQSGVVRVSRSRSWPNIADAKPSGWVELYLVSNDEAAGHQAGRQPVAVQEYADRRQLLAESFMKMSAEDRRKAAQSEVSLILDSQTGYGKALLQALAECADRPVKFSSGEGLAFALAKYVGQGDKGTVSADSVVDAIPLGSLARCKTELQKALAAIDARLARTEDSKAKD